MEKEKRGIDYLKVHKKAHPRCTNKSQLNQWLLIIPQAGHAGFCEDCTPEFQAEKSSQGMCDHPEVLFYTDKDGMTYGTHKISYEKDAMVVEKNNLTSEGV